MLGCPVSDDGPAAFGGFLIHGVALKGTNISGILLAIVAPLFGGVDLVPLFASKVAGDCARIWFTVSIKLIESSRCKVELTGRDFGGSAFACSFGTKG